MFMQANWRRLAPAIIALACMLAAAGMATAEDYPSKPVRLVVGFSPGSATDIIARIVGGALNARFGQAFVVENRPGANGLLAANAVAKAKPDGYTLLVTNSSAMTVNPLLYKDAQYDTLRDFIPITPVVDGHFILTTNPANPRTASVASLNDLIALAKARPGTLTYGSAGAGNLAHLGIELLSARAGVSMIHVPYRAATAAQAALLAGEVDFNFDTPSSIAQIKAGRLKALAVTMPRRWPELPEVPAVAEFYPGFDVSFWFGFFTPAGTPEGVTQTLNQEIIAATNQAVVREQLARQGGIVTLSPQAFAAKIGAETAQNAEVIRRAKIKID
jgi:tripartite-type tricarboxylate transporter receptor subunit TctC